MCVFIHYNIYTCKEHVGNINIVHVNNIMLVLSLSLFLSLSFSLSPSPSPLLCSSHSSLPLTRVCTQSTAVTMTQLR